jgi:hypothetical protein
MASESSSLPRPPCPNNGMVVQDIACSGIIPDIPDATLCSRCFSASNGTLCPNYGTSIGPDLMCSGILPNINGATTCKLCFALSRTKCPNFGVNVDGKVCNGSLPPFKGATHCRRCYNITKA